MNNVKCVVVGDGAVGKTSMLIAYTSGTFPSDYVPTVFDNYETTLTVDHRETYLGLWDTAGQEGYDRLRPLSYPQTQVFLICFAINSPVSFKHVETKWRPEVEHHCPGVPFIVVGTKGDIREDSKVLESMEAKGKPLRPFDHYMAEAKKIGAMRYMECSALKNVGLQEVFEEVVRTSTRAKSSTASGGKKKGKASSSKGGSGKPGGKDCLIL